ncbi:OadG family protein [Marispirochaeta aestuarii]|uniref:OadG family protein n=1 Tax=Marispirochaeta aestuarii TaxID=1963862 RepID=UPI001E4C0696|nr:OadG family protein [Marispirochaeta aestuarii]
MIAQGLVLTVVGMTVVFLFLTLLVILMNVLSAVVIRYFPEPVVEVAESSGSKDAEIAAVIAAVKAYIS